MRHTKGFTLIELLVVVGIIGLLSSIVLVAVFSGRSRARDGRRKADLKQLQGSLELYFNATAGYPDSAGAFVCADSASGEALTLGVLTPDYLPALPVTQAGTQCPKYRGETTRYKLTTYLENSPDTDAANDGGTSASVYELFTSGTTAWGVPAN